MNSLVTYLKRLFRTGPTGRVFRCTNCGCTYETDDTACQECWNERLVRIE